MRKDNIIKKIKQIINPFVREILCTIILSLVILLSLLTDLSVIKLPPCAFIKFNDIESLLLSLFAIEASISTISIAIVSIISSTFNEVMFGISVSQYIVDLKHKIFKHKIIIILNLCITGINYFCVSYTFYNLSITLFVLSIVLNIFLVKSVYIIFLGKDKLKIEIMDYIVKNYNEKSIKKLTENTLNAIEMGNSLTINDNYIVFKRIFSEETKKSKHTDLLSQSVGDIFKKIVIEHNSKKTSECMKFIADIYDIVNFNKEAPLYLELWTYISRDFYNSLKDLTYEDLQKDQIYIQLRYKLYDNIKNTNDDKFKEMSLKAYSARIYNSIFKNPSLLSTKESEYIKNILYGSLFFSLHKDMAKRVENSTIEEICWLHYAIINNGDCELLKKCYFELRRHQKNEYIYIITLIYLYYLSKREGLVNGKPLQNYALEIIKQNKSYIEYFYFRIDIKNIISKHYPSISSFLNNCEYMEESKAKWIIMDIVTNDFFLFTIISKYHNPVDIFQATSELISSSIFSIYQRLFPNDEYKYFKEQFTKFNEVFTNNTIKDFSRKIMLLKDALGKQFKNERINDAKKDKITDAMLDELKLQCISNTSNFIQDTFNCFSCNQTENKDIIYNEEKGVCISKIFISTWHFKDDNFKSDLYSTIKTYLINYFIKTIRGMIKFEKVNYDSKSKQELLINLVNSFNINGTVLIGDKDRYWHEENENLLSEYTTNMTNIKHPDYYGLYLILDDKLIEFSITNIKIMFEDVDWCEIVRECKKDETGKLTYNLTNDLYIPFEEEELKEYIHDTERKLVLYADIKYRLSGNIVGAGIEITLD